MSNRLALGSRAKILTYANGHEPILDGRTGTIVEVDSSYLRLRLDDTEGLGGLVDNSVLCLPEELEPIE